jgi:hypothetical protein
VEHNQIRWIGNGQKERRCIRDESANEEVRQGLDLGLTHCRQDRWC